MEDATGSLTFLPAPLPDKGGPSAACLTDANMSSITKACSALLRAAVNARRTAQKKDVSMLSHSGVSNREDNAGKKSVLLFIFLVIIKTNNIRVI